MAMCGKWYSIISNEASIVNAMHCSVVVRAHAKIMNDKTLRQMPYGPWKRDKD